MNLVLVLLIVVLFLLFSWSVIVIYLHWSGAATINWYVSWMRVSGVDLGCVLSRRARHMNRGIILMMLMISSGFWSPGTTARSTTRCRIIVVDLGTMDQLILLNVLMLSDFGLFESLFVGQLTPLQLVRFFEPGVQFVLPSRFFLFRAVLSIRHATHFLLAHSLHRVDPLRFLLFAFG